MYGFLDLILGGFMILGSLWMLFLFIQTLNEVDKV